MLSRQPRRRKTSTDRERVKLTDADGLLKAPEQPMRTDPDQEWSGIIATRELLSEYHKQRNHDRKYIKRCS